MALLAHGVEKIKGTEHKNGNVDGTCKRDLASALVAMSLSRLSELSLSLNGL